MNSQKKPARILRQSLPNRIAHWSIALSTFALFVTGFGQMPVYARYGIAALPGMAWTADYGFTLAVHYVAGAMLFAGVAYHVTHAVATRSYAIMPRKGDLRESAQIIAAMLGKGEEPASHKYLAEQRLAYAFIGINTLIVLASGVVKVVKNLPGSTMDSGLIWATTLAHNVSAALLLVGIIGHFAAFAIKINRKLLPAMFDGKIEREYAEERHELWFAEIHGEAAEERAA